MGGLGNPSVHLYSGMARGHLPPAPSLLQPPSRRLPLQSGDADAPEGWPWQSHYACTQRSLRHLHTEDRPNKVINQYPIFKWIWGGWGRPLACTLKTYMPHTVREGLVLIKRRNPSDQPTCIYLLALPRDKPSPLNINIQMQRKTFTAALSSPVKWRSCIIVRRRETL